MGNGRVIRFRPVFTVISFSAVYELTTLGYRGPIGLKVAGKLCKVLRPNQLSILAEGDAIVAQVLK